MLSISGSFSTSLPPVPPRSVAARLTESSDAPAYVVDFSPLAYGTPSPHDSAGGSIVHLGSRPALLAELDSARLAQKDAFDAEMQAKEDERSGKTIKPFTLREFLEKMDEKFDLFAAKRQEQRNPLALTNDQKALLRDDRLGGNWKKRFGWLS